MKNLTKRKRRKSKRNTIKNKSKRGKGGGIFSSKKEAKPIEVHLRGSPEIPLKCLICGANKFYTRQSMLRGGRWASFFDTEWLFDKKSVLAICEKCSHIHWFKDVKTLKEIKN